MEDENKDKNSNDRLKLLTILLDFYESNPIDKKIVPISKNNYEFIVNYINNTEDKFLIPFFNCLNDSGFPILKLLIDGYIKIDFEDETNNKLILDNIAKFIKLEFNKNIFKCIYKHLSKLFRKNYLLKDINAIKRFEKIFNVWKLLYNVDNNSIKKDFDKNINNEHFEIDIKNEEFIGDISYIIEIYFNSSEVLNKMKIKDNFFFVNLYDINNIKLSLTYLNLFDLNSAELFKKTNNKMILIFSKDSFAIVLNGTKIKTKHLNNSNINFGRIYKLNIMNYIFFAEIYQINIQVINVYISEKTKSFSPANKILDIQINKELFSGKFDYSLNLKSDDDKLMLNVKNNTSKYVSFNGIKFGNNRAWIPRKKRLGSIQYYGGIESFIPLIKIIKYIIANLGNDENKNQKENADYLEKSIGWIKDIIKIILRVISLSEKNYLNFQKIIIPLICSFAEISHNFNKLVSKGFLTQEKKKSLFNDEVIYSLFIAIINTRPSKNVIEAYTLIFELEPKWNINFSLDYLFFDVNNIKDTNFLWYFSFLYTYALFILIYNDSLDNCPKSMIEEMDKILSKKVVNQNPIISNFILSVSQFINLLKRLYTDNKEHNFQLNFSLDFLKSNYYYLKLLIIIMKTVLNVRFLSKINKISYNINNSYIIRMMELLSENKITIKKSDEELNSIIETFYNYHADAGQLEDWLGIKGEKLISSRDLLINELIDYHGEYHKLMKELFLFNRLWSKDKIFNNEFDKKHSGVKYKNINYYTRNFQRPIIYPILDYKYRYPLFSQYKMKDDFYRNNHKEKNKDKEEKLEDDYNFNLECPEFDEIIKNINLDIYSQIKINNTIKVFNVCLVKQIYHVKGNLFLIHRKNKFKIIFFSYLYDFENDKESFAKCNKIDKENNKSTFINYEKTVAELCFGQIFKCPEKEKNRKIEIDIKDIRMLLKKIYFYRKSAVEIYTETKSYFFNFFSTEEFNKFMSIIEPYFENEESKTKSEKEQIYYLPVNITNKKIGYLKTNKKISKIDFVDFISNNCDNICNFDIIMFLNLVSNRSYIDLNQYPVFPVLFFYEKDKDKSFERNFKSHIGFQNQTPQGKKRCEFIKSNYNDNKIKTLNEEEEEENEDHQLSYFNTHYSNIVYSTNFMVRIFPYSFCAIELQGKYFDDPNRLFFSIENTLRNISCQISDLRELIPEFFYLPEMLYNINNLNFLSLKNGNIVDDVIMPEEINLDKYVENEAMTNILNDDNISINIIEDSSDRKNIFKIFLFILRMKNGLENMKDNLAHWLNIIFGTHQRYTKKKEGQYFRTESYLDLNDDSLNKYSNDIIIMKSVEFGLIPLKIISDQKAIYSIKNKKSMFDKTIKNQKIFNDFELFDTKDKEIYPYINEKYWDSDLKICFKVKNRNGSGKLEIYSEKSLLYEIIDHTDEIINVFYNRRLNMFATCSYDGFACIYILPNKLISIIKHPKNLYFNNVFLSANPYPTIITYERTGNTFCSYSLSGILINRIELDRNENSKINFYLHFDVYGGCHKDRIEIELNKPKNNKIFLDLPFFDEVK